MKIKRPFKALSDSGLLCWAVISCQSGQPELLPIESLCGGKPPQPLTLTARTDGQDFGFGRMYAAANGSSFFYVGGNCEYWANDGSWVTAHGTLDFADVQLVDESLEYTQIPRLAGQWRARGCLDPSFFTLNAADFEVVCECTCDATGTPAAVRELQSGFREFARTMTERGEPWLGAVEILIMEDETTADQSPVEWPLSRDMAEFVVSLADVRARLENNEPVVGIVIDEVEEAAAIRQVMIDYAAQYPDRATLGNPLPLQANGTYFALYAVDVLPGVAASKSAIQSGESRD